MIQKCHRICIKIYAEASCYEMKPQLSNLCFTSLTFLPYWRAWHEESRTTEVQKKVRDTQRGCELELSNLKYVPGGLRKIKKNNNNNTCIITGCLRCAYERALRGLFAVISNKGKMNPGMPLWNSICPTMCSIQPLLPIKRQCALKGDWFSSGSGLIQR